MSFSKWPKVLVAAASIFVLAGCSAPNPGARSLSEAYVKGLTINKDLTAQDIDFAAGDLNYCQSQLQLSGVPTSVGFSNFREFTDQDRKDFINGCLEFVHKRFGTPENIALSFSNSASAKILKRLNEQGDYWNIGSSFESAPAGYKVLISGKSCSVLVFSNRELAQAFIDAGLEINVAGATKVGIDAATNKGVILFFVNRDQLCAKTAQKVLNFG